jgi:hypothetical protein
MTDQTQLLREALRARMCASCPITDPEQACCMPDARAAFSAPAQPASGEAVPLNHKQATGSKNCMQCCVSYMLGLPIDAVPDFEREHNAHRTAWELMEQVFEWHGCTAEMFPPTAEITGDYLASGTTDRGTSHMVVMRGGKLLHDPHPSNAGLEFVQAVWIVARKAGNNTTPPASQDQADPWKTEAMGKMSRIEESMTLLADKLEQASQEQAQPAQCDGGTCGLGGYCDKCPKQAQPSGAAYCWAVSGLRSMFHGEFAEADARDKARRCGGAAQAFPLFREAQPSGEVVHQWRKQGTGGFWYDGHPDNEDGGGPYETRTLYTAPQPAQPAVRVAMTEVNDVGLVPKVITPFTPAQRRRLWENSPEHHKDAASITGFERIVTLTERAHGITSNGATDA